MPLGEEVRDYVAACFSRATGEDDAFACRCGHYNVVEGMRLGIQKRVGMDFETVEMWGWHDITAVAPSPPQMPWIWAGLWGSWR